LITEYAVCFGTERVGSASVSKEGLYYRIRCQCQLSGDVPCRITVSGERDADLGLCVPLGDHFGVETRIPIKRVGEGNLSFQVTPKHRETTEQFIPISPEEPFQYLARLKDAYLIRRNGQAGIAITDRSPDQPDSGQSR